MARALCGGGRKTPKTKCHSNNAGAVWVIVRHSVIFQPSPTGASGMCICHPGRFAACTPRKRRFRLSCFRCLPVRPHAKFRGFCVNVSKIVDKVVSLLAKFTRISQVIKIFKVISSKVSGCHFCAFYDVKNFASPSTAIPAPSPPPRPWRGGLRWRGE